MAIALKIGIHTFRTLNDPLSGVLHVASGSSRGRGARKSRNRAKGTSLRFGAGSDDGSGPTDGESAHSSAAHAGGPEPCAGPAGTDGSEAMRAPNKGDGGGENSVMAEKKVKRDLPRDPFEFAVQVNEEKQLVDVVAGMLDKSDERVKQKVLQQVLSMAYAKSGRRAGVAREDGPDKLTWNLPR